MTPTFQQRAIGALLLLLAVPLWVALIVSTLDSPAGPGGVIALVGITWAVARLFRGLPQRWSIAPLLAAVILADSLLVGAWWCGIFSRP